MAFNRPTLTELLDRVKSDFQTKLGIGKLPRRSYTSALTDAYAGAVHLLHGHLDWNADQLFPDTAEADNLSRWATIWGISRIPAAYAIGDVTFTGADTTVIALGTRLKRSDGALFDTTAEGTITTGTATVAVKAVNAGTDGNTDADVNLTLESPISGIDNTATVAAGGLIDGLDEESDDSLRTRVLNRIQQPPHGGADFDYIEWALSISEVTRVWVYPNNTGLGTVGVSFVTDDAAGGIIPDGAKVTEVQDYIDTVKPVTADVTVFAPTAVPLDFTIEVTPDTTTVRAAVEASLQDLLKRDAEPAGTILISKIREAVSVAAGETDNTVTVPAADVTHTAGQIATFGTITWT